MASTVLLLLLSFCSAGVTWAIGTGLGSPDAPRLDIATARRFFRRGHRLARFFTQLAYPNGIAIVYALASTGMLVGGIPLAIPALVLVVQLVTQQAANLLKLRFARKRPAEWIEWEETTPAYPSGHSTTAVAFYGSLAYVAVHRVHNDVVSAVVWAIFVAVAAGIGWSRIALGAHYLTDVVGGYALGAAGLFLFAACFCTSTF